MELVIVIAIVAGAATFAGWKLWGMVKPGAKGGSCSCSSPKNACSNCPLVKP